MRKRSTKSWSCNPAWSAELVRARRKMRFAPAAGVDMVVYCSASVVPCTMGGKVAE